MQFFRVGGQALLNNSITVPSKDFKISKWLSHRCPFIFIFPTLWCGIGELQFTKLHVKTSFTQTQLLVPKQYCSERLTFTKTSNKIKKFILS
jgi:hypothetical protein